MSDIFIGRQPILSAGLNINAYELLFRSSENQSNANVIDGDIATSQVMLNTFVDIGLENLVGKHKAYINLTQYFLEDSDRVAIPPGQVVLEVLEDVEPNEKVIATLGALKKRGYIIALDDFIHNDRLRPLVGLANIVKLDVMSLSDAEIEQHVRLLKQQDLILLAEKVETLEEFEYLKQLGFDYFQGYFFAKPTVIVGKGLTPNQLTVLQLIAKISNPDVELDELSEIISTDISLSHKVLRFINSPASGIRTQIDSIPRAVSLLGLNTVKNWVTIVSLASCSEKPDELSTLALVRARTCELLARATGHPEPEGYFTAGLFSLLDAMMDQPMSKLLDDIPLAEDLKSGLLTMTGPYGQALKCMIAMERNDIEDISFFDLKPAKISELYLEALLWANQQGKEMLS